MRLLDPSTFRTMPWKNGRGTTDELLVLPPGADLDSFDLRLSLARVSADGAFSSFPGVDRTILVVEGEGMKLTLSDDFSITLDRTSTPFSFTADDPCDGALAAGPITDLNVMTRRKVFRHRVTRVTLDGEESLACTGELAIVVVLDGEATAKSDDGDLSIGPKGILVLAKGEPFVRLATEASAELVLVDVWRR